MGDRLPLEILVMIFSFVPREDLARSVQFVCPRWKVACWDRSLWTSYLLTATGDCKTTIDSLAIFSGVRNLSLLRIAVFAPLFCYLKDSCPTIEKLCIYWEYIYNGKELMYNPLPQIRKLNLHSLDKLYLVPRLLHRMFPNLEHLELLQQFFTKADIAPYLKLKRFVLHTVTIACHTADGHCVLLSLAQCENLKKLRLFSLCEDVGNLPVKELQHFSSISSLTLEDSNVNHGRDDSSVLKFFSNISDLELRRCCASKADTLLVVAKQCPRLLKLALTLCWNWREAASVGTEASLKWAHCLGSVTHLTIHSAFYMTDELLKYIKQIPKLTHLDLYDNAHMTNDSLYVIYGFDKLQVCFFDLKKQDAPYITADDVKNRDLQLLLYRCKDLSWLDSLQRQHLRVGLVNNRPCGSTEGEKFCV